MRIVYFILTALIFVGCDNAPMTDRITRDYKMECTNNIMDAAHWGYRCENSEVICYSNSHGLVCKFKTQ